ncbi:MAG: hypothetical protein ACI9MS_003665, partial [Glaciecola sp.]
ELTADKPNANAPAIAPLMIVLVFFITKLRLCFYDLLNIARYNKL